MIALPIALPIGYPITYPNRGRIAYPESGANPPVPTRPDRTSFAVLGANAADRSSVVQIEPSGSSRPGCPSTDPNARETNLWKTIEEAR